MFSRIFDPDSAHLLESLPAHEAAQGGPINALMHLFSAFRIRTSIMMRDGFMCALYDIGDLYNDRKINWRDVQEIATRMSKYTPHV